MLLESTLGPTDVHDFSAKNCKDRYFCYVPASLETNKLTQIENWNVEDIRNK